MTTPNTPDFPPPDWTLDPPAARVAQPAAEQGAQVAPPGVEPGAPAPRKPPRRAAKPRQPLWRRSLGLFAAIGFLVFKFGAKLKVLLLLLPKIKLFTTSASMLVSIGAYSLIWGWKFALGFVLLLFAHEMGHVWQARREGIAVSAPMFIPFLGALIMLKEREKDAAVEARIGLAGPIVGGLACLVPVGLYATTGNELFQAVAFVGFLLNLFNLLPVLPLDGGRAMAALSPWLWIVGFGALVVLAFVSPSPVLLLVILFGGLETWRRFKQRKSPESQAYSYVPSNTRFAIAAVYIGLAVALALGMQATFVERSIDDARQQQNTEPLQAG